MTSLISKPRSIALGATVLGVALLLAGCAADTPTSSAPASTSAPRAQGAGGSGAGGGGVFGEIAAVNGSTLQVQSQSAQTAVNVSASTTVLQTEKGSLSDVTVGSCVVASSFGGPGSSAAPSTSGAVTSVTISPATNGTCTGFGGGFGGRGFGGGGGGTRTPRPTPTRTRTFTPPVAGVVTAVSGDTITVTPSRTGSGSTSGPKTVTTASTTVFTVTSKVTSAALTVGRCAAVRGPADSSGAVTATSVTVSDPGANGCTQPFGRRPGGGAPGGSTGTGGGNA